MQLTLTKVIVLLSAVAGDIFETEAAPRPEQWDEHSHCAYQPRIKG